MVGIKGSLLELSQTSFVVLRVACDDKLKLQNSSGKKPETHEVILNFRGYSTHEEKGLWTRKDREREKREI
jgi:hypothetical protein